MLQTPDPYGRPAAETPSAAAPDGPSGTTQGSAGGDSFVEYMHQVGQHYQSHISALREARAKEELEGCTHHPFITPYAKGLHRTKEVVERLVDHAEKRHETQAAKEKQRKAEVAKEEMAEVRAPEITEWARTLPRADDGDGIAGVTHKWAESKKQRLRMLQDQATQQELAEVRPGPQITYHEGAAEERKAGLSIEDHLLSKEVERQRRLYAKALAEDADTVAKTKRTLRGPGNVSGTTTGTASDTTAQSRSQDVIARLSAPNPKKAYDAEYIEHCTFRPRTYTAFADPLGDLPVHERVLQRSAVSAQSRSGHATPNASIIGGHHSHQHCADRDAADFRHRPAISERSRVLAEEKRRRDAEAEARLEASVASGGRHDTTTRLFDQWQRREDQKADAERAKAKAASIAKQRAAHSGHVDRFLDRQSGHQLRRDQRLNKTRQDERARKEEEMRRHCTHRPALTSHPSGQPGHRSSSAGHVIAADGSVVPVDAAGDARSGRSASTGAVVTSNEHMFAKGRRLAMSKEQKIAVARAEQRDTELEECVFTPCIHHEIPVPAPAPPAVGVEAHLARMQTARAEKAETARRLKSSGTSAMAAARSKDPRTGTTVPKEFSFQRRERLGGSGSAARTRQSGPPTPRPASLRPPVQKSDFLAAGASPSRAAPGHGGLRYADDGSPTAGGFYGDDRSAGRDPQEEVGYHSVPRHPSDSRGGGYGYGSGYGGGAPVPQQSLLPNTEHWGVDQPPSQPRPTPARADLFGSVASGSALPTPIPHPSAATTPTPFTTPGGRPYGGSTAHGGGDDTTFTVHHPPGHGAGVGAGHPTVSPRGPRSSSDVPYGEAEAMLRAREEQFEREAEQRSMHHHGPAQSSGPGHYHGHHDRDRGHDQQYGYQYPQHGPPSHGPGQGQGQGYGAGRGHSEDQPYGSSVGTAAPHRVGSGSPPRAEHPPPPRSGFVVGGAAESQAAVDNVLRNHQAIVRDVLQRSIARGPGRS